MARGSWLVARCSLLVARCSALKYWRMRSVTGHRAMRPRFLLLRLSLANAIRGRTERRANEINLKSNDYPNLSITTDIGRYGTHSTQTAIYNDRFSENLVVIGPVDSTCILYCTYFLLNKLKTTEVKIRCHTFLANRCAMRARRFYVVPSTKPITTNNRSL